VLRATLLKALLVATGGLDIWEPPDSTPSAAPGTTVRVLLPDGSIVTLDLETYLYGVVPIETSASWPAAALQAQAIIARTYALQKRTLSRAYDLVSTDADQRYGGPGAARPATTAAVDATRGQTLGYRGGTASVFYSSCCGGHSADAAALWGHADLPYLRGVADGAYCTASPDYRWQRSVPIDRARAALGDLAGTPVSAQLDAPDASGRPHSIAFRDDTGAQAVVSVGDLRTRLGADTVRSLWLRNIVFDRTQAVPLVVIEGSGRGHGVGLCQWGARGMALAGAGVRDILAQYFPGTTVTGA
jgi:stage II sporulation protein D